MKNYPPQFKADEPLTLGGQPAPLRIPPASGDTAADGQPSAPTTPRVCGTADRWGRNPNWRHYYYGANIALSFRRIKALKRFRARSCWTRWRGFGSCGLHAVGVYDLIYSVHKYRQNYRYLRDYNQSLTYAGR